MTNIIAEVALELKCPSCGNSLGVFGNEEYYKGIVQIKAACKGCNKIAYINLGEYDLDINAKELDLMKNEQYGTFNQLSSKKQFEYTEHNQ